MDLSRSLLKEFAQLTTGNQKESSVDKYMRGTVKVTGEKKYVQIDGSDMVTPISETVDVQEGDRVVVSIDHHRATILGNLTYPPSARKEQEALERAEDAKGESSLASEKAQSAIEKAEAAEGLSSIVEGIANEAKQNAAEALQSAENAKQESAEALSESKNAVQKAEEATNSAASAQQAITEVNVEINKINQEVTGVRGDISSTLETLGELAKETETIKETMELSYAKKTDLSTTEATLRTEISKSVGELKTTISEEYSSKSEMVEMEGKLQSQITQNKEGLTSTSTKVEKLESDTANAQVKVAEAKAEALKAQNAANSALENAATAQQSANDAKTAADVASQKAQDAQTNAAKAQEAANAADLKVQGAQADLQIAKENLTLVTNRVGATEQEVADAQAKVDAAQQSVNQAIADAAEADAAAKKAQDAATLAQTDAANAQLAATDAQTKADNAKLVADQAQLDALKAQEEVTALTHRVTTAETQIKQNTESIELSAYKIDEVGQSLKETEDNLRDNYYSKLETDAKLKVESDKITTTVQKVETVERNSVTSTEEQFYLSSSPTQLTGGSWSDIQPQWTEGKFIWRRTLVTKGDGTTFYTPSENGVCITGNTGADGASGMDLSQGEMLYKDPSFISDQNGISLYNKAENSTDLTLTREAKTENNPIKDSTHELRIQVSGENTNPGFGGFGFGNPTRANAIFVYRIIAEIPEGRTLNYAAEQTGDGYAHKWLTDNSGTGVYTEYLLKHTCGSRGSFSSSGYFYLTGGSAPSPSSILEWHVAYATVFDMTANADALAAFETANQARDDAADANTAAQSNTSRIEISESEIKQLADSISMLVTDENGSSMMEQTSDGWTFNIGSINETLSSAANELNNMSGKMDVVDGIIDELKNTISDLGQKTAYIVMTTDETGAPCIELGKEGNEFKVRITNTSVDFMEGTSRIAYVNNNSLYIERAIIKNELQIGEGDGFIWQRRQNGNLGLRWIGGN